MTLYPTTTSLIVLVLVLLTAEFYVRCVCPTDVKTNTHSLIHKLTHLSCAYCCASSVCTFLLDSMSALLPASAITTWGTWEHGDMETWVGVDVSTFVLHVYLCVHQCWCVSVHQCDLTYIGVPAALKFLHPALGAVERVLLGNVKHDDGSSGPAIVHWGQASVTF